jgi:hypothetical protein
MKAGLVLPRVFPGDPVRAERIDEHIRSMAEHINGGLTVTSLSPTLRIPIAAFVERFNVFTMSTPALGQPTPAQTYGNFGTCGVSGSVIGIGWSLIYKGTGSLTYTGLTILKNGVNAYYTPNIIYSARAQSARGQNIYSGSCYLGTGFPVAIGDWLTLAVPTVQYNGTVTLTLAVPHTN